MQTRFASSLRSIAVVAAVCVVVPLVGCSEEWDPASELAGVWDVDGDRDPDATTMHLEMRQNDAVVSGVSGRYARGPGALQNGDVVLKNFRDAEQKNRYALEADVITLGYDPDRPAGEPTAITSKTFIPGNKVEVRRSNSDDGRSTLYIDYPYGATGLQVKLPASWVLAGTPKTGGGTGDAGGGGGGGGGGGCIVGTWNAPGCGGGAKKITLALLASGKGSLTNPDCNGICTPIIFPFDYTSTATSVSLRYTAPNAITCNGKSTPINKPTDDSFTYVCSGNTLTTTTSKGSMTYTK